MKTYEPNQIEIIISKLDDHKCRPMTIEETKIMVSLMFSKSTSPIVPEKKLPFMVQLIKKRIEHCFTFKMDFDSILFLSFLSETPGIAVIYLWYLQYWCKTNEIREITFDVFVTKIFPWGFFKKESLHSIWEEQKVDDSPDNMFDHANAGKSLQFEFEKV